jgi:hypothetical protein
MHVMTAAVVMTVAIIGQHHAVHFMMVLGQVMLDMQGERLARVGMDGSAFHRDGRKRLNRQAQCQQHDDEEFAPI